MPARLSSSTQALVAMPARPASLLAAGLLMIGATGLFSMMDAIAKHLGQGLPVLQIVWARYAFHVVALLVLPLAGHSLRALIVTQRPWLQFGRSVALLVSTALYFWALRYIPLAEATALAFVSPLIVTALAAPLLGERIGPRRWIAVGVGFAGALVMLRPGLGGFHWAMLLPLAVGFTRALYMLSTRALGATDGPLATLFYSAALGAAASSFAMPFEWSTPGPAAMALMILLGFAGAMSSWLLIRAYMQAPSAALAPFSYFELAWALALGWFLFGELPDRIALVGGAIIAGAGVCVLWPERDAARLGAARVNRYHRRGSPVAGDTE
jgi:drug/metabolite transporter (DMT)-like permease